jgi:hypothetical protein
MAVTKYKTDNYTIFERRQGTIARHLSLYLRPKVEDRLTPQGTTDVELDRVEYSRLAVGTFGDDTGGEILEEEVEEGSL